MAKRRKTNTNRKKHSQNGEIENKNFMNNIEEGVNMPSVSELASAQNDVEASHNFDNNIFDGSQAAIKLDQENITNQIQHESLEKQEFENRDEQMQATDLSNEIASTSENQTLGAYFKTERNKKGVSLKNISQNTKISHTNLEFLENDNYAKLPNKTYVYGYVKSYAKTLGLDQNHCLELARKHYDSDKNEVVLDSHKNSIQEPSSQFNAKFLVFLLVFIALSAAVFLFSRGNKDKEVVTTPKPVTPAIKVVTSQTPLKTEALTETENESEATADEKIEEPLQTNETKPDVVKTIKKEEPIKIEPKKKEAAIVEKVEPKKEEPKKVETTKVDKKEEPQKEIDFTPIASNLYTIDSSKSQSDIDAIIPARFKNAIISGYQNVFITASNGNTWLTYKSDDKPIKKFVLKEGRNLLIRGKEIRLFLGNINAIDVFLNNKPLSLKSSSGVKSLVFPQENGKKYKLPLFIYKKDGTVETSDQY